MTAVILFAAAWTTTSSRSRMLRSECLAASERYARGLRKTSTAADTAPQPLWPRTTTSLRLSPRWSTAYLRLPEHFAAEAVAGDADDEQVVRSLAEDQLDRHACVGAAQHRRVGTLARRAPVARREPEIARVHSDDPPRSAGPFDQIVQKCGERAAPRVEAVPCRDCIGRPRPVGGLAGVVPIGDFDDAHRWPRARRWSADSKVAVFGAARNRRTAACGGATILAGGPDAAPRLEANRRSHAQGVDRPPATAACPSGPRRARKRAFPSFSAGTCHIV